MLPQITDYPIVHLERLSGRRFYDELNSISIYPKNHSMSIYVIYIDGQVHKLYYQTTENSLIQLPEITSFKHSETRNGF